MSNKKDLEIAVVGGGIGGLCAALALLHRDINVTVYEAAHHFGEIGAGISFTPNAIQAMTICHPEIERVFKEVRTLNAWESKRYVYFDAYDGCDKSNPEVSRHLATNETAVGQNGEN